MAMTNEEKRHNLHYCLLETFLHRGEDGEVLVDEAIEAVRQFVLENEPGDIYRLANFLATGVKGTPQVSTPEERREALRALQPPRIEDIADTCREVIKKAEADGIEVREENVVDLIADNISFPLSTIRSALVIAGYSRRFPNACSRKD